ncbi:hypothetical protein EE612_050419, partial [Oryza sativa]
SRRRRPTSPSPAQAQAQPLEDDDLLSEILLRLPAKPSSLPRASLVCKRWRRVVSDSVFLRRFRSHHGKPPLLGFFKVSYRNPIFIPTLDPPDRISAARFSLQLPLPGGGGGSPRSLLPYVRIPPRPRPYLRPELVANHGVGSRHRRPARR